MTALDCAPHVDISLAASLDELIETWRRRSGIVLALQFAGRGRRAPIRAVDSADPAAIDTLIVGVAPSPSAATTDIETFGVREDLVGRLAPWLGSTAAPYCVFADGHRDLRLLIERGVTPRRLGCIRTAATLVAEGADGRRDERPLSFCARDALQLELDEPVTLDAMIAATRLAIPILRAYTARLRQLGLTRVFELECELLPSVIDMEQAGVPVDSAAFERVAASWASERESTTDSGRLARLDKLLSTYRYWDRDYTDYDGRMRCHFEPLATDSGRFACSSPNLQQIPTEHTAPGLRACFRAPPGRKLIIADYAQIELRVAAHVANCAALRDVFRRGGDPHRTTAATLTRKAPAAVSDHERKLAKAINFGFLFGMGAKRFAAYARASFDIELDLTQARRAREAFLTTYPGIAAWHERTGALSRRTSDRDITVRTVLGRRKRFLAGEFSFTTALNIPVQGTAAEGFKRAMIDVRAPLQELGGTGVLCVHDEYVAEVPEEHAEHARALVERILAASMGSIVDSVPIVVESQIADTWR